MDELRWLLLGFGALTIVAVYLYSRRETSARDDASDKATGSRVEPTLGDDPGVEPGAPDAPPRSPVFDDEDPSGPVDDAPGESPAAATDTPQKIVTLRVVARDRGAFRGDELILSLRGIGMRHGKFGIFHRFEGDESTAVIFSAASLVEPGSFDLSNIKEQEIPGISLFAVLPGPVEGVEAFDLMMATAKAIANAMEADLLDESGSTLSIQRERYLREEIIQFEHSLQVSH